MNDQQPGYGQEPANNETRPETASQSAATPSGATPSGAGPASPGSVFGGEAAPTASGWGQQQDARAPGWGASGTAAATTPAAGSRNRKRGLAIAVGAVVLAVGAGAGAFALTSNPASADGTTVADRLAGPGGQGVGPGGASGGGMQGRGGTDGFPPGGTSGLLAAVHAEYVILEGGNYLTQYEQLGTVTDISSTAMTVESSDGFTRSYTLGPDVVVGSQQMTRQQAGSTAGSQLSIADIEAGSTVRMVAVADGADYAAVAVTPTTATAGQAN